MSEAPSGVLPARSDPAIVVQDVHKDFDGGVVRALNGVDLTVQRGEYVALTGPSGCGKSTLLHLIAALDEPSAGTVLVAGQDVTRLRNPAAFRRDRVGLVFQLHNLLPQLTAAQNIEVAMFGTGLGRRQRSERARELLAQVDLTGRESHTPPRLSGGERQRVAIARALANKPSLLLADEPTGNLDSAAVRRIVDLLADLRSRQPDLSILLVTHDPSVAAGADRIVHMRDGKVVADELASRS
jgi:putative ABC transport system ATP-binding protein